MLPDFRETIHFFSVFPRQFFPQIRATSAENRYGEFVVLWNDTDRAKPKYSETSLSKYHFVNHKYYRHWTGIELVPAIDRLSHSMVIKDPQNLNHVGTFSSYRAVNILLVYEQRWFKAQVKNSYWIRKNMAKIHLAMWKVQPTLSLAIFATLQEQCCHYTCKEVWGVSSVEPWRRRVNKGSVEMCYQNTSLLPKSVSDRPSHVLLTSRYTASRRMSMFGWWYTAGLRRNDRTAIACVRARVCVCLHSQQKYSVTEWTARFSRPWVSRLDVARCDLVHLQPGFGKIYCPALAPRTASFQIPADSKLNFSINIFITSCGFPILLHHLHIAKQPSHFHMVYLSNAPTFLHRSKSRLSLS